MSIWGGRIGNVVWDVGPERMLGKGRQIRGWWNSFSLATQPVGEGVPLTPTGLETMAGVQRLAEPGQVAGIQEVLAARGAGASQGGIA